MSRKPRGAVVDPEAMELGIDEDLQGEIAETESRAVGDLADLDNPDFEDISWNIYRIRSTADMEALGRSASPRVWIAKKIGPINLVEIQTEFGGGKFEFWGKRGARLIYRYTRDLEGEPIIRKTVARTADVVITPNATGTNGISPHGRPNATLRLIREMRRERRATQRMMLAILQKPAPTPPPPPTTSLTDIVGAVAAIHQLGLAGKSASDPSDFGTVVKIFREGLALGQEREPIQADGTDPNPWFPVVSKGVDVIASIVSQRQQEARRRSGMRPQSQATVVGDPGARTEATAHPGVPHETPSQTPPPTEPPAPEFVRWAAATDRLYRGLSGLEPAEDVADDIAGMLDPTQYAMLVGQQDTTSLAWQPTVDQVLAYLASPTPWGSLLARYPALEAEDGKAYLERVLVALRTEDDETQA